MRCRTPEDLLATVDAVLQAYDTQMGRGTMVGQTAGLMNPEVIDLLRDVSLMIRKKFL
jgi:hypothetical protein